MSFIQREIDRIKEAILAHEEGGETYQRLHAANQALGWALEPNGVKSPYDTIMGIQKAPEDCLNVDLMIANYGLPEATRQVKKLVESAAAKMKFDRDKLKVSS